jgi:oligopeptidase B
LDAHEENEYLRWFYELWSLLSDQGYTSPEHLYTNGVSAGGLLMGLVNLAPAQLPRYYCRCTICRRDKYDAIGETSLTTNGTTNGNQMKSSLRLYEKLLALREHWGLKKLPAASQRAYDSQVQYLNLQMGMKLRAAKTIKNVLLLQSQHGIWSRRSIEGRFDYLKDIALKRYAF